jgi:translation elongation factor EF-1alpha
MTSGICLAGKVVTGWLQEGDPIVLLPNHEEAVIKGESSDQVSRENGSASSDSFEPFPSLSPWQPSL